MGKSFHVSGGNWGFVGEILSITEGNQGLRVPIKPTDKPSLRGRRAAQTHPRTTCHIEPKPPRASETSSGTRR